MMSFAKKQKYFKIVNRMMQAFLDREVEGYEQVRSRFLSQVLSIDKKNSSNISILTSNIERVTERLIES
jgi:hypothetical protein